MGQISRLEILEKISKVRIYILKLNLEMFVREFFNKNKNNI